MSMAESEVMTTKMKAIEARVEVIVMRVMVTEVTMSEAVIEVSIAIANN